MWAYFCWLQISWVCRSIFKTMPSCPGLNSYTAFHNRSNCWVCGALPSSSMEGFPWWTSPLQGKDFCHVCEYLQQQSHVMPLLHLMTSTNPKMDWCTTLYFNYGHNVTFNFDYTLSQFNEYFATHKANRSGSNGFLLDFYQIWDEVIWLTPGKRTSSIYCPYMLGTNRAIPKSQPTTSLQWLETTGIFASGCMQRNHSRVFQPQFKSSLCLARH